MHNSGKETPKRRPIYRGAKKTHPLVLPFVFSNTCKGIKNELLFPHSLCFRAFRFFSKINLRLLAGVGKSHYYLLRTTTTTWQHRRFYYSPLLLPPNARRSFITQHVVFCDDDDATNLELTLLHLQTTGMK